MTGIRGAVTPTGGGTAKTWVWTPQLSTSVITLDTATVELAHGDGTTNHYYAEAGYMFTTGFKISSAFGSVPKLSWTMAGRARQTDTITGALSAYSSLEELTHPLLTVYQDTTWAGLGGSQPTNIIRSVDFDCMTGLTPDYTADGRTDKDMTKHSVGSLGAKLNIVAELDANGLASSWTLYRSNSPHLHPAEVDGQRHQRRRQQDRPDRRRLPLRQPAAGQPGRRAATGGAPAGSGRRRHEQQDPRVHGDQHAERHRRFVSRP